MLREAGASFTPVMLDQRNGFPPQYEKLNPKKRVPVLVLDDGSPVTEVPAILTAISQLSPEQKLLGKTNLEVVRSYEWFNWLSGTLHAQAFGCMWRSERFTDDEAAFESIRKKGRTTVEHCFATIEGKLHGEHAVGDSFTAVDAYLFVFYRWGNVIGFDMKGEYPKWHALVEELVKKDSVRATVEAEGIALMGQPRPSL